MDTTGIGSMKTKVFDQAHSKTTVPLINEVNFHLVITNDIHRSHTELGLPYAEKCVRQGGEVHMDDGSMDCYLFLCHVCVTHEMIGHELHHALDEICEFIGQVVDMKNDEMTARIAGFLNGWTYLQLEQAGIPVTHEPQKV